MIFNQKLEWDTLSIQAAICDHLKDWKVENAFGFTNAKMKGKSAFIISATKKKFALEIVLENEKKQMIIKGGIHGKYLPNGQKKPKFSKIFKHTQLKQASNYFEKILEDLK